MHDLAIDGTSLKHRRRRATVSLATDLDIDIHAVGVDEVFSQEHTRLMSWQSASISSYRFVNDITVYVVRSSSVTGVTAAPADIANSQRAVEVLDGILDGLLSLRSVVVETEPVQPDDSIVLRYKVGPPSGGGFSEVTDRVIRKGVVTIGRLPGNPASVNGNVHEILHALGCGHTGKPDSVMWQGAPLHDPSLQDRAAIRWKYSRLPGAHFEAGVDID